MYNRVMYEWLKNFIALLFGVIIALIGLEAFLSFYNPFEFRQTWSQVKLPKYDRWVAKNESIQGLDSIIVHTKNGLGFRGEDFPNDYDKRTSIITVGGSTTECFYSTDGKDWPTLLRFKLDSSFSSLWINNAGLDGHSTFGHQVLMRDVIIKLNPRYVTFLIGCNDVEKKDLGAFDKNCLVKDYDIESLLWNRSNIASTFVNIQRGLKARNMKLGHNQIQWKDCGMVTQDDNYSRKVKRLMSYQHPFLQKYEMRIRHLVSMCRVNDIIPILITQPTVVGVGIDNVTEVDMSRTTCCSQYGGGAYWKQLELYNDVTRSVAENEGVSLIDLARKMSKSTELFYDCVHFTNQGNEIVSEIIFQGMDSILRADPRVKKKFAVE